MLQISIWGVGASVGGLSPAKPHRGNESVENHKQVQSKTMLFALRN